MFYLRIAISGVCLFYLLPTSTASSAVSSMAEFSVPFPGVLFSLSVMTYKCPAIIEVRIAPEGYGGHPGCEGTRWVEQPAVASQGKPVFTLRTGRGYPSGVQPPGGQLLWLNQVSR